MPGHKATPTPTLLSTAGDQVYQFVLEFVDTSFLHFTVGVEI